MPVKCSIFHYIMFFAQELVIVADAENVFDGGFVSVFLPVLLTTVPLPSLCDSSDSSIHLSYRDVRSG